MTKKQQTILLAIIGVVVVVVIVVVGVGVWVATSLFDNIDMDEASATKTIDDVRAKFANAVPVLVLQPQGLKLARKPPDTAPAVELKTLHILRWDVHEERLTRVELPFWMLRLKDSPIDVMYENESTGLRTRTATSIRVSDIERFGPALLVDGQLPDGGRIVAWTD
jgi:hypothetical protein